MIGLRLLAVSSILSLAVNGVVEAQSQTDYARQVDSLARLWRPALAVVVRATQTADHDVSGDSMRVGAIRVRADSQYIALARATAERLAPIVERTYGRVGDLLAHHTFVIRAPSGIHDSTAVMTGIADSLGELRIRSVDLANPDALVVSWERKVEETVADEVPGLRDWVGGIIQLAEPTPTTWSDARISLILGGSVASADCTRGDIARCEQALGLVPVNDPAFTFYDASERKDIIERNAQILRRSNPPQYDRCIATGLQPACDSLIRQIPGDAVPVPTTVGIRESLARYALLRGGAGAFERFAAASTPRERIESASKLPLDSVVAAWRTTVVGTRRGSTALDMETALSSLAWAGLCACLALRSSRWR